MRFVVFVCLSAGCTSVFANDESPLQTREVLEKAVAAVDRIRSLYCEVEDLAEPGTTVAQDSLVEKNSEGHPAFSFSKYWWDARDAERVETRVWCPPRLRHLLNGEAYEHYVYTIHEIDYRGYSYLSRVGKLQFSRTKSTGFTTPLVLLGHHVEGLRQHLCRHVYDHGAFAESVARRVDGGLQITAEYNLPGGGERRRVAIVCDPEQDYLPVRIRTWFSWSNSPEQEIDVTATAVINGVRLPVAGRAAAFAIDEVFPDGLTNADINSMSRERYFSDIEPRVKRIRKLLADVQIRFDPAELKVNEVMPLEFFRVEIPADCEVMDLTQPTLDGDFIYLNRD